MKKTVLSPRQALDKHNQTLKQRWRVFLQGGMTAGFEDASGSFTGWGAAVDYCIAQGTSGVCPLAT
eukprot:COSAG06_NODE_19276_length_845_cov_1.650134_1_plen_65_part_10